MPKAAGWRPPPPQAVPNAEQAQGAVPKAVSKAAVVDAAVAAAHAERPSSKDAKADLEAQIAAVKARLERVTHKQDDTQATKRAASSTSPTQQQEGTNPKPYKRAAYSTAQPWRQDDAQTNNRATSSTPPQRSYADYKRAADASASASDVLALENGDASLSSPKFCPCCGGSWVAGDTFCVECGASAKDIAAMLRLIMDSAEPHSAAAASSNQASSSKDVTSGSAQHSGVWVKRTSTEAASAQDPGARREATQSTSGGAPAQRNVRYRRREVAPPTAAVGREVAPPTAAVGSPRPPESAPPRPARPARPAAIGAGPAIGAAVGRRSGPRRIGS